MIGAMPAVAVRHERRKGQEKRSKRPSQLYIGGIGGIGGHWLPPVSSPSPTPTSPFGPHLHHYHHHHHGGHHSADCDDRLPEYYLCGKIGAGNHDHDLGGAPLGLQPHFVGAPRGPHRAAPAVPQMLFTKTFRQHTPNKCKVSALQVIVGSILLGAIVFIVGLVQMVPNAADADHRYIFLGAGTGLLVLGFVMTGVRCFCIHCRDMTGVQDDGDVAAAATITTQPDDEETVSTAGNSAPVCNHEHTLAADGTAAGAVGDDGLAGIDVVMQRRDTQVMSSSELDVLIKSKSLDKDNTSATT